MVVAWRLEIGFVSMDEPVRTSRRRSLWPREHGAYAQLIAPLVSVLLLSRPTTSAVLLAVAAIAAFLSNEPLLVLLGHRGARMRDLEGPRARGRLVLLGTIIAVGGASGLGLAPIATLAIAAAVSVPASVLLVFACRRQQHSFAGELVAALALPGACAPVAVASGIGAKAAALLWIAWSIGFVASVFGVHRVIARHRRAATIVDRELVVALVVLLICLGALGRSQPLLLTASPLVAVSALLIAHPPRACRLRAVGVVLVIASIASICVASAAW